MCHKCEDTLPAALPTPSDDTAKHDEPVEDKENDDEDDDEDDEDNETEQKETGKDQNDVDKRKHQSHTKNVQQKKNDPQSHPPTNVCQHYAKGKCRHGMAGKGCSKNHPRPCRKLLRHGPKSRSNPDGCPGLPTCNKWHPQLCRASVKNRQCTYDGCKFRHIAGTKRADDPASPNEAGKKNPSSEKLDAGKTSKAQADHFLDVMEAWKKDLLDTIDAKIRSVQMQTPPYQSVYPWGYPGMQQEYPNRQVPTQQMYPQETRMPQMFSRQQIPFLQ